MELKDLLNLLGFFMAVGFQTWGIVKYMLSRMDAHKKEFEAKLDRLDAEQSVQVGQLHDRVNGVQDQYVKRRDLDREIDGLARNVAEMKNDFHRSMESVNTQLNQVIGLLTRKGP